jgi:mono/diheme cytochrome c family protein
MRNPVFAFVVLVSFVCGFASVQIGCEAKKEGPKAMTKEEMIAHGKYLVSTIGCGDCHSPKNMTPQGPVPDQTRMLSGHPASSPPDHVDWDVISHDHMYLGSADMTAWYGPWGASFTANLTPDKQTGIGAWTEEQFMQSLRTGKHFGSGRQILPPMPWMNFAQLTDDDLKAVFAYLQSLPPINNPVPAPLPPEALMAKK